MNRVTAIGALRAGIQVFIHRFPLLMGVWIIILGLNQLISLVIPARFTLAAAAAQVMIFGPLYVGQYFVTLRALRDQPTRIGDVLEGFSRWGTIIGMYLAFVLVAALAISLLGALLGLIGYALATLFLALLSLTYAFVPILLVDRDHPKAPFRLTEALSAGALLARGRRLVLFCITLLLGIPFLLLFAGDYIALAFFDTEIPTWLYTILALLGGMLFIGPVSAASFAVVYEAALTSSLGHRPGTPASVNDLDTGREEVDSIDEE